MKVPVWALLRGLHPFTVVVEPDDDWSGELVLVVSNNAFAGPTNMLLPTLSDPITGPYEFSKDSPYQFVGVRPTRLDVGIVHVNIFASPYSRNIQP